MGIIAKNAKLFTASCSPYLHNQQLNKADELQPEATPMHPPRKLDNFSDPIGLLRRMLSSGNRAAYAALFREALSIAAKPFDAFFSVFENRRFAKETNSDKPLILIVGAPRSGTTLIYQTLAAYLDITSPSNLTAIFPRSPLTVARLQRLLPKRSRPDFRNFYGQTTGLAGPNDAFHLWNRWLGHDRYRPGNALTEDTIAEMRQFFDTWTATFDKPFLNKNNRNAFAIERLAQALPNAKFVVVRRNPILVAQSLIVAREKVQGNKTTGWGLQSSSSEDTSDPLAYVDDVCQQIVAIDTEMNRQIATVSPERIIEITYEGFCEDPAHSIRQVASGIAGLELNTRLCVDDLQAFKVSRTLSISTEEQSRIQAFFATDRSMATHD